MLTKNILDWKEDFGGHEKQDVSGRKEVIDMYASTGTLVLYYCYLNSVRNKMFSMIPSLSFTQAILSYYHQISIPPQLLPSPKNWPFLPNSLCIFRSSSLLIFPENRFFTFPLYIPYNLRTPPFYNPSGQLVTSSHSVPMSSPYKAFPNLTPLYPNSSWLLLCPRSHFQAILLLLLLL